MCRFYSEEQQGAGLFTHMGVDETNLGGPLPAPRRLPPVLMMPCPCQRNRPKQTPYADTACRNHTQASAEGIPPTSFPSGPRQVTAA